MKKFLRFGAASAVVAASLGMSTVAQAQDSASADAFAEILTALELSLDTGSKLDFGAMVVTGAGVVSLDAATGNLDCSDTDIVCSGTTELATDPLGDYYEVTLSGTGTAAFEVGGDLTFDGTEVAGVYTGTFDVSVEYS